MITNERQYRITRAHVERFEAALFEPATVAPQRTDMRLVAAERDALASQLGDLREELSEYEHWKASDISMIKVSSFNELPLGLIRARIASGLTQRDLANRLDLKEQQIQEYESEFYRTADYQRLRDVADALGVRIANDILLPATPVSFSELVSKLQRVGINRSFLVQRLMSTVDVARTKGEASTGGEESALASIAANLSRVFGWCPETILGHEPLDSPRLTDVHATSKIPSYCNDTEVRAYITYAIHLARVVAHGTSKLPILSHSDEARGFQTALLGRYDEICFRNVLGFAWDLGIPVLPLRDSGNFRSACWRFDGRNVIVLKRRSSSESRWMLDLLLELYHARQQPNEPFFGVISAPDTSAERSVSEEEISASRFGADVILDGNSEDYAQQCIRMADGNVERFRDAIRRISAANNIDIGTLANYMAFRLSWENTDWWDAAQDLQEPCTDPWETVRDVFLERFPFALQDEVDRGLLRQALKGYEYDQREFKSTHSSL